MKGDRNDSGQSSGFRGSGLEQPEQNNLCGSLRHSARTKYVVSNIGVHRTVHLTYFKALLSSFEVPSRKRP